MPSNKKSNLPKIGLFEPAQADEYTRYYMGAWLRSERRCLIMEDALAELEKKLHESVQPKFCIGCGELEEDSEPEPEPENLNEV